MEHPVEHPDIEPLSPDSELGAQIAEELSAVFADIRVAIAQRRAAAASASATDAA